MPARNSDTISPCVRPVHRASTGASMVGQGFEERHALVELFDGDPFIRNMGFAVLARATHDGGNAGLLEYAGFRTVIDHLCLIRAGKPLGQRLRLGTSRGDKRWNIVGHSGFNMGTLISATHVGQHGTLDEGGNSLL